MELSNMLWMFFGAFCERLRKATSPPLPCDPHGRSPPSGNLVRGAVPIVCLAGISVAHLASCSVGRAGSVKCLLELYLSILEKQRAGNASSDRSCDFSGGCFALITRCGFISGVRLEFIRGVFFCIVRLFFTHPCFFKRKHKAFVFLSKSQKFFHCVHLHFPFFFFLFTLSAASSLCVRLNRVVDYFCFARHTRVHCVST